MALLNILTFPDPRLNIVAKSVSKVDARIQKLVDDLAETMYEAPGIGLAATQVDVHERVIVIDVSEDRKDLRVLINPQVKRAENFSLNQEGCLSVPGIYDDVERAQSITVEAINRAGELVTFDAEGLLAVCIQHEMDHLEGKVFVEYLSVFKQSRIKTKMKKRGRDALRS